MRKAKSPLEKQAATLLFAMEGAPVSRSTQCPLTMADSFRTNGSEMNMPNIYGLLNSTEEVKFLLIKKNLLFFFYTFYDIGIFSL